MSLKELAIKIKPVVSTVTVTVMIIGYMCIGAVVFVHIEHNPQLEKKISGANAFLTAFDQFENILLNSTASNSSANNTSDVRRRLIELLSNWSRVAQHYKVTEDIFIQLPAETDWSFYESLLFTFSLVTTVGYGVLTPDTLFGRFFCICYSVVGIPLCMIGIANIGKFMSAGLLQAQQLAINCWWYYYATFKKSISKSSGNEKETNVKLIEISPNEHFNEAATLSPVTLFSVVFLYLMVGSVIISSYEEMDWFTACYFCFISITTVGLGDVVPKSNPCPTLMYLAVGLALTTLAIEMGVELLLKLHYLGRKFTNAKNTIVRFGGRKLTVNDMVRAIGQKYNIPVWEIDKFTDNMDKFIEQTFVDKANGKLYPSAETTLLTTNPEFVFQVVGEFDYADAD